MTSINIKVKGVEETISDLKRLDESLAKDFKKGLREDVRPLFQAYKRYAAGLGGVGTYASNAHMRTIKTGIKISNTDPAAGVKEFANIGALANKGPRRGKPVGVPYAPKPRALMRARDEYEPDIIDAVERRIQRAIDMYLSI